MVRMKPLARPRVLVVDDDPSTVELISRLLRADYDVQTAESGEHALQLLDAARFDAVIADQRMPGLSGSDVLTEVMAQQPLAARILVTASGRVEDAEEAINRARVGRFLAKPFHAREFLATVASAVREAQLEMENHRLVVELENKNALLQRALDGLAEQERRLQEEVERRTAQLQAAVAQLEHLALRDGLTGLFNHRYFQESLTAEVARAPRHQRPLALLFIDVDSFKHYNDLLGHPRGDELLRQLARIITNTGPSPEVRIQGRLSDVACRYGGEEFVVLLPEADRAGGRIRAERLRAEVEQFAFAGRERQPGGRVTVSIGVAAFPEDASDRQGLVQAADQALYVAKRAGRNRVIVAGQGATPGSGDGHGG